MKKLSYTFALLGLCLIMACGNDNKQVAEHRVTTLRVYVDSVKAAHHDYNDENYWALVESGYEERKHQTEEKIAQADEKTKAEYEKLQVEYDDLKRSYVEEREKALAEAKAANDYKMKLRNSLYGEGVIGEDMNFSFMNAGNALATYEHFVKTVKANREAYSREDWDEIKVLYEAMDTRKNEIEKELPAKDNMKIAGYKIEFSAIKSVERPLSKMKENSDAKDKDPGNK